MALFNKRKDAVDHPSPAEVRKLLLREDADAQSDWLWQIDASRRLVGSNPEIARAAALESHEVEGMPFLQVLAGPNWESGNFSTGLRTLAENIKAKHIFRDLLLPVIVEGQERWWEIAGSPRFDVSGKFLGFLGVASDVTEARASADRINRLARFDATTGLPNRLLVQEALEHACANAEKWNSRCQLLIVSVTNLNNIKGRVGYSNTEKFLGRIAESIAHIADDNVVVGQISPGEFAIVWRELGDKKAAAVEIKRFVDAAQLNAPEVGAVVYAAGGATSPEDGKSAQEIITAALERVYPLISGGRGNLTPSRGSLRLSAARRAKGRAAVEEGRRHVIALHGPPAEAGLTTIIEEHRLRLHNNPPESLNQAEIEQLLELRQELQNLILLAGEGADVRQKMGVVANLTRRVFNFSHETGELFVAGLKPFLASVPLATGTLLLLQAICTPAIGSVVGPGAALAVLAGYYGLEVKRPGKTSPKGNSIP